MSRIYLSPPHLEGGELELIEDALRSNWIAPLGPHVDAFEEELADFVGVPHAAALASGTAALHLALLLAGVGPGDEVLASTLSFVATGNAILYVGARPVWIDADARTWTMDPRLLEEELRSCHERGRPPRAVVVVDLYGQSADYDEILTLCNSYGVPVIEDAAEALGATYRGRPVGGFGRCGVFSFNGNKIITTSGGGMLVSSRREDVERARFLATQARDRAPHYQHSALGFNYRMSNVLAALGRGQLRALPRRVAARRANFQAYRERLADLPGLELMPQASYGRSNCWLTCLTLDPQEFGACREDVRQALEACDIESRPLWKPLHLQPLFRGTRVRGGEVSERLFEAGLCLPSGTNLAEQDLDRVVSIVRRCARRSPG